MSQFFQLRPPPRRAPRVSLRGTTSATVQLENGHRLIGRVRSLSTTGGLLELPTFVEERVWVNLTIQLSSGPVHPTAEMMFPMRGVSGYVQPFRITKMWVEERGALEREITALLAQNAGGKRLGLQPPRFLLESL